jgi:hypothetical protein
MSVLGQTRTSQVPRSISALSSKADIMGAFKTSRSLPQTKRSGTAPYTAQCGSRPSLASVSEKREYLKQMPETFCDFALKLHKLGD